MANVSQWSTVAGSGYQFTTAPPDGAPESHAAVAVNDIQREVMAALARWYGDTKGALVTTSSGNAYSLSTNSSHAALADQSIFVCRSNRTNTGACTFGVDSLTAKNLVHPNGEDLRANDIKINQLMIIAYNANQDKYFLLSSTGNRATDTEAKAQSDSEKYLTPANLAGIGVWKDSRYFESAEQSITNGAHLSIAHSLGSTPKLAHGVLVCKSAEFGYSVGDEVQITGGIFDAPSSLAYGGTVHANATNVEIQIGADGMVLHQQSSVAGDWNIITNASWRIKLRAFA